MSLTVLLGSVGGAVAASGSVTIGNGGADGEVGSGFWMIAGSSTWTAEACYAGRDAAPAGTAVHRFAIEFPLVAVPPDATITGASLALRTARHDLAQQTAIYGYAGDGAITAADVEVSGAPILFTPTSSVTRESHDITNLLTPDVVTAGWAGLSVRQEPMAGAAAPWDCPVDPLYPILTIEYTTPDPTPDVTTVPNTATAGSSGGFPLNAALGMILIGSGIGLTIGAARSRRRSA